MGNFDYEIKYQDFFERLTGFAPYSYQEECCGKHDKLKSFILNAPTGSGKTWAAISPFIYSWYKWRKGGQKIEDYPRKLIYSLPLRTLANSLFSEVNEKVRNTFPELNIKITLQTGENPTDSFFEGDIIFTTIDQTLSNVLSIPLSLSKSLSNINAGAVISSYLVFDEFHLLEPQKSLSTALILLNKLKDTTPFCLMTATLSKSFMENTASFLDADLISITESDYKNFAFVKNEVQKAVNVREQFLEAKDIIELHKEKTIVICNTVNKCIQLYKSLKGLVKSTTEVVCLHSQFFQKDRKDKEQKILNFFGKNSYQTDVILITTQVIEVGLDISCDTMLTEISPINSFLQRIGRCVRWYGSGNIYVFDCQGTYLPYKKELSLSTFKELGDITGANIDYFVSRQLIENILNDFENDIFTEIQNSSENVWENIKRSWGSGDKSYARSLIRNIQSISVVLLPRYFKTNSLFLFDSISMNPFSLEKKLKDYYNSGIESQPVVFSLKESQFIDDEFDGSEKVLHPIEINEVIDKDVVALNSEIVGYSKEYGLDFYEHSGIVSEKIERNERKNFVIYYDTYEEHINWMLECLGKLNDYHFIIKRIQQHKYSKFNIDDIVEFIIKAHDFGKLNDLWQNIVRTYQERKIGEKIEAFIAHSDFDPSSEEDKKLTGIVLEEFQVGKKPNHAGVGGFLAFLLLPLILKVNSYDKEGVSFIQVIATTILRHHSSFADKVPQYKIADNAFDFFLSQISKMFPEIRKAALDKLPVKKFNGTDASSITVTFENKYEAFLYFVLVRLLRLCDQHSFDMNPRVR